MRRKARIGFFALTVFLPKIAFSALYFPAAFPATYDVLVCQQPACSFEHPEQADYTGTLVLFSEQLSPTQLALPNKRQYTRASHYDGSANACFAFAHQNQTVNYIWQVGLPILLKTSLFGCFHSLMNVYRERDSTYGGRSLCGLLA